VVVSTVCLAWIMFWLIWGLYKKRELVSRLLFYLFLLMIIFVYLNLLMCNLPILLYSWIQSWYKVFTLCACTGVKSRRGSLAVEPVTANPPLALPAPPPSPVQGPKQLGLSQLLHWPRLTKVWVENEVRVFSILFIYLYGSMEVLNF
jgi:hypothetical protein